jgi:hypothetical protein
VKIDNKEPFFWRFQRLSYFLFEYLRRCALASSGQSLQHVSSKNAGAGKLCALLHKIENRIFSLAAEHGQAA